MQFFGQVVVDVSAVQQERTASAVGNIMVSFPADTGNTDNVGDSGGTSDTGNNDTSGESGSGTNDVIVAVELPVTWTEDGKAVAYVTFEFNDEEILIHHPVETWGSGKHILSLYYPIDNLVPNITNTFNVYLRIENGTGEIETGACIASISGQAMAAAAAWDGKITVEEMIHMETMELVQRSYADSIGKAGIGAFGKPFVTVQEGL